MFSRSIFYSCCLCLFITITGGGLINTLTTIPHIIQPTVFLIYEVDVSDLQAYIDPRLKVATFDNKAYVVIFLSNESVSYDSNFLPLGIGVSIGSYPAADIYTIVEYNGIFNRETLFTALDNPLVTPTCQFYSMQPYGCYLMNSESKLSLDNQTEIYNFSSSTRILSTNKLAQIDLSVKFQSTQKVDYNDLSTLAGFYLSSANNQNAAQSSYQHGQPNTNSSLSPISTSQLNNLFYMDVYECTIDSIQSNYITTAIGNIVGLNENQPTSCFYTPYYTYDSTIALPSKSR